MSTPGVRKFLQSLAGKSVYFDPLFGNHGDRLISMAAEFLLQAAALDRVSSPDQADWILVNGGGGMAEGWPGLGIVADYSTRYPQTPLAVLPSSFLFREPQPERWFRDRSAPLYLWARERPSLKLIDDIPFDCDVHIGLDHDLAFALADHPMLESLRRMQPGKSLLAVERDDWESPTGRQRPLSIKGLSFIPETLRNRVRKVLVGPLRKRQDDNSAFGRAAQDLLPSLGYETGALDLHCEDISLAETCSFDGFLHAIAASGVIVSTRLHVAVMGQLLGRTTVLVEGSYHKAKGVYEHSMQGGKTRLAHWDGSRLQLRDAA